jgi:hypothetical protein
MSTTMTNLTATVKAQAQRIVADGKNIRSQLSHVVAKNANESERSGGLVDLVRAAIDGAREGLAQATPEEQDNSLRKVVDALGDGLSHSALAAQLALQEAVGSSQRFAKADLARLRDDLTSVRELFVETIERGLSAGETFTRGQIGYARTHAERVAERLGPALEKALDAVRQHPLDVAREGIAAGVSAAQGAAGSLFQAVGRMLERTGCQLRHEGPGK